MPRQTERGQARTKILEHMRRHNGYITSREVDELGVHREWLRILVKEGKAERMARGVYVIPDKWPDPYYALNLELPKVVFSHMTALYFHDLSIKAPDDEWDMTVPRGYHSFRLKWPSTVFYVSSEAYGLGLTKVRTNFGNYVNAYDVERSICDIIRSKEREDYEYVKYAVREYLRSGKKNLQKLVEYAAKLGVQSKVERYVELQY